MARWRARSRLIRRLRLILPAAMGAILLALAGWVAVGSILSLVGEIRPEGQALIHMTNAHFYGRDSDGRPYVLAAVEAYRDDNDLKLITLKLPTLTLDTGAERSTRVSADHGVYREDSRIERLDGHVTMQTAAGDVFKTDTAVVDTVQGTVAGPAPVVGTGPTGEISAERFDVYDRGARVVFRGEVHSRMKRD
ncbi:MAG: LPS export ABC transporter periplasmic protein LptC [Caulobacteraceae bacterium]|nr:LPS export ABC transporter periplasmic protein LptC [Caulobacteraceae bacterium]